MTGIISLTDTYEDRAKTALRTLRADDTDPFERERMCSILITIAADLDRVTLADMDECIEQAERDLQRVTTDAAAEIASVLKYRLVKLIRERKLKYGEPK